jgi:hypothetical protein
MGGDAIDAIDAMADARQRTLTRNQAFIASN